MSLGFSRRDARFCGMGQQPGVILLVLLMFFGLRFRFPAAPS